MKSSPPHICISVAKAWERNGWQTALLFLRDHFSRRWHSRFQKHRKKVLLPKLINLEVWKCGADHWPHWPARPFPPGQWQRAKAQSPGARRRRPSSVASHEQLQPAFPQERDLTPPPPHQQPSPPPRARSGGAKHSGSVLTSQCSAKLLTTKPA